jgi:hypothetical protein
VREPDNTSGRKIQAMLRYAYFADFKSGPKLLFWGEGKDMERLTAFLRETARGKEPPPFSQLSWSRSVDGSDVAIVIGEGATGLQRRSGELDFVWRLDRETADDFSQKVGALARVGPSGHQYLECGVKGEITVMVSRSEYPPDLAP